MNFGLMLEERDVQRREAVKTLYSVLVLLLAKIQPHIAPYLSKVV